MAYSARRVLQEVHDRNIIIFTSNTAAATTVYQSRQESGQEYIRSIYDSVGTLQTRRHKVPKQ